MIHLASFILLIVIIIMGNILLFNHINELNNYYEISKKWIYIFNVLGHIILPIILIYYLYNRLVLSIKNLTNIRINTFIFILILAIIYHILIKLKMTSSYGISYSKILEYSFISIIIVIIILYNIQSILK